MAPSRKMEGAARETYFAQKIEREPSLIFKIGHLLMQTYYQKMGQVCPILLYPCPIVNGGHFNMVVQRCKKRRIIGYILFTSTKQFS